MDDYSRDNRELYREDFELWQSLTKRIEDGTLGNECLPELKNLLNAYGKLLNDTVKLGKVSDLQHAWLIDSQDRLRSSNENLQKVSSTDKLTGLLNRHRMDRILQDEVSLRLRSGTSACLILIDIDHFKRINDTWGHNTGDEVLVFFAQILKNRVRSTDSCARWGGDEFLVLLPNTTKNDAIRITEQIRQAVADAAFPSRAFTVSLGVSEIQPDMNIEDWLALTDRCLYWAKHVGRNTVGHPDLL